MSGCVIDSPSTFTTENAIFKRSAVEFLDRSTVCPVNCKNFAPDVIEKTPPLEVKLDVSPLSIITLFKYLHLSYLPERVVSKNPRLFEFVCIAKSVEVITFDELVIFSVIKTGLDIVDPSLYSHPSVLANGVMVLLS